MMMVMGRLYLKMVSTSMPEKPKAESPSTHTTRAAGSWSLEEGVRGIGEDRRG